MRFRTMTERGSVTIGADQYLVRKEGPFKGRGSFEGQSGVLTARKTGALSRHMTMHGPEGQVGLTAKSIFSRTVTMAGTGIHCEVVPVHAFTRRATISGRWNDFRYVAFGFWLTVLTWRRAAAG